MLPICFATKVMNGNSLHAVLYNDNKQSSQRMFVLSCQGVWSYKFWITLWSNFDWTSRNGNYFLFTFEKHYWALLPKTTEVASKILQIFRDMFWLRVSVWKLNGNSGFRRPMSKMISFIKSLPKFLEITLTKMTESTEMFIYRQCQRTFE